MTLCVGVEGTHRLTPCVVDHTLGVGCVIHAYTLVDKHWARCEDILILLGITSLLASLAVVDHYALLADAYHAIHALLLEVGSLGNLLATETEEGRRFVDSHIPVTSVHTKVCASLLGCHCKFLQLVGLYDCSLVELWRVANHRYGLSRVEEVNSSDDIACGIALEAEASAVGGYQTN